MCTNVHNVGEQTNPTGLLTYISNNVLLRTCSCTFVCVHMYVCMYQMSRLQCIKTVMHLTTVPVLWRRLSLCAESQL